MKLSNNLVPILNKDEFDIVALEFLEKYYPQALERPMAIPIESIATQLMNLQVKRVHLSEDLSILGQVFFSSGQAEIYLKDTEEFIYENVNRGTMFIDPDVATERNVGSERNTIAHECVHWYIHRPYHTVQILAGGEKAVASRCPIETPSEQVKSQWTDEDWMEWHANGIAPKILMPKMTFIDCVTAHSLYGRIIDATNTKKPAYLNLLTEELADFFQVSKQSASIRLSELGLI